MNGSGDNTSEAGRRREEADYTNAQTKYHSKEYFIEMVQFFPITLSMPQYSIFPTRLT